MFATGTERGVTIWGVSQVLAEATEQSTPTVQPTVAVSKEIAPRVGSLAPDFELPNVRPGKPAVKLSSLRSKPVMVVFWGSWCPPCRDEMAEIQKVYDKFQGQVEVIGVSGPTPNFSTPAVAEPPQTDENSAGDSGPTPTLPITQGPSDEPISVNQYIDQNKYAWTFVHDADSRVFDRYQVTGIPGNYFIDKDGIIRAILVGGANAQMIEENLRKALNPATSEPPQPVETIISQLGVTPTPASAQPTPTGPPRISLADFKAHYDDPAQRAKMLIIDVRAKESYDAGHIKGAESWPESDIDARVVKLPRDKLIVAYCQ
jgi:peroxiredoxin